MQYTLGTITFEDTTVPTVAQADYADVYAEQTGLSYNQAVAAIEARMPAGPWSDNESRLRAFDAAAVALIAERNPSKGGKTLAAGLPWLAGIAMLSIVLSMKRKRR